MTLSDKTLTCVDCGYEFTFTAGEQEFFASKGYTNEPRRCPNAGVLERASREVSETPPDQPGKCTRQFAPSAARTRWFPSGPAATSPSTVATASAQ